MTAPAFDITASPAGEPPVLDILQLPEEQLRAMCDELLEALGGIQAERAMRGAAHQVRLQDLQARYDTLDQPLARNAGYLETRLRELWELLPKPKKAKSIRFPFGVLGTRHHAQRLKVESEDELKLALRELQEQGSLAPEQLALIIRVVPVEKVNHESLTSFVAANQWKPLPGTTVTEERDDFYAKAEPPAVEARD